MIKKIKFKSYLNIDNTYTNILYMLPGLSINNVSNQMVKYSDIFRYSTVQFVPFGYNI